MNDRQRIALAAQAGERLTWLVQALEAVASDGSTVLERLRAAQGPLRGRCYEAPASGRAVTGSMPSPAGDAALRDEADLDAHLAGLDRAVSRLWAIVGNYPPAHVATSADRRALGLGDGPWCTSCLRVLDGEGVPRREPATHGLSGELEMTLDGQLVEPDPLCGWCHGARRDWGRTPSLDEVTRHARGQRVAWPADVPRPA